MKLALALLVVPTLAHAGDDVLVWTNARLAYDATGSGGIVLDPAPRALGDAVPMRVVSETATAVEVEPIAVKACTDFAVAPSAQLANLRLFVSPRDLAPVVTAAWRDDWTDGGHVALAAGIPIDPVAREVLAFDRRIPVDVPATAVGTHYPGHAVGEYTLDTDPPPQQFQFRGTAKLGGRRVFDASWMARSLIAARGKGKTGFAFGGRCVEGVAIVDAKDVAPIRTLTTRMPPARGRAIGHARASRDYLPAGTAMTGRGGTHVVATLAVDVDVARPTDPKAPVCHDFPLGLVDDDPAPAPASSLTLCAPTTALRSRETTHR